MNLKPLAPIPPAANIKYSPISSQININSHMKDLFTSVPTTRYNMSEFQQKVASHANRQEKNSVCIDKTIIRTWLTYVTDV